MACITKRRGRYVIDCYDKSGKRYRKTLPLGLNREERRKALRDIEEKIEQKTLIHGKNIPLFSEVKEQWLDYKKQYLRETTWETYSGNAKNHFNDLDPLKITQISTATIENFIGTRQKQGMNINTLRKILVSLNQIMAYAVRHRFIGFNPVREAERPRNKGKEGEQTAIAILTPDQIRAFLDKVEGQKYKTLFLTAIMTGARQGEILGLKWSDIDFQKKQICINRTFNMGRFFTPKTKGSVRRIDLAPVVVKELAAWKLKSGGRNKLKKKLVLKINHKKRSVEKCDDLVFPNEAGEPMNSSNLVLRHFRPALKKAEIGQIRFHDLRHTYASLLIHQGENIKYIQTQLGHSSPTVTLNVYTHLMKDQNQEAACRLENSIFQATGHKTVTNEKKVNHKR